MKNTQPQKNNKPRLNTLLAIGLSLSVGVLSTGCIATADEAETGAGVYYLKGDLEDVVSANIKEVKSAVQKAIKKEGFFEIEVDDEAVRVMFHVRDEDDEKISVKITRASDTVTKINVRFGLLGDKARSIHFMNSIKSEL